ncbi:MAG: UvrABC system protein C [Parcubacteria group bacterium ADurb.Bin016]|jgi:excinuclease UvrABC nuclease subunit|nr:MAG: UvrABC system protein C [Parcubacteria group bacterium ADurb.Bin016]
MSRINNYNSLYNIDQKPEPFIETGAYTAYKKIPLGIKGVYIFYDFITGRALYVGKAKDLRKRLYSYTKASYGTACEKFKEITDKHLAVGLLAFTCDDNYLLEDYFIKTFTPPFNVRREL